MRNLKSRLCLITGILASISSASENIRPPVSLKDAIRIAETFVEKQRIDVSKYHLASAQLEQDKPGKAHWDLRWNLAEGMMKGGWFVVRVEMDKTATLISGK
jgi:hypothetical protein